MRRRRTKRATLGVSLFPFLAVLICTLGVLIILLVLAVRSADVRAVGQQTANREQREKQQAELNELTFEFEKRAVEIEARALMRPDSLSRLVGVREHRGHLEVEIRKLKQRISELSAALLALDQDVPAEVDLTKTDARIAELKRQILLADANLETTRSQSRNNATVTYSIVPHAGNGGTFRRPIFIECTADALTIQPLGIRLLKAEFSTPLGPGNMLDAALLAIREYRQKYDLDGDTGSPYPLLVVRPDGAETYALARHAMASWEDEFGYEMIEAHKTLDFGQADEQLKKEVQAVVDDAKIRQRSMVAGRAAQQRALGNRPGQGSSPREANQRPGLTASGPNGGFVANSALAAQGNRGLGDSSSDNTVQASMHQAADSASNEFSADDSNSDQKSDSGSASNQTNSNSATAGESTAQNAGAMKSPYDHLNLAKTRGKQWALPTQTPGATGYVRPIRVVCSENELEIRSALGTEKTIPIGDDITTSVDPLINEIWRQIESWGLSGDRSFWKPELRISVLPGGELNFEKLRGVLHDSGVEVKESQ